MGDTNAASTSAEAERPSRATSGAGSIAGPFAWASCLEVGRVTLPQKRRPAVVRARGIRLHQGGGLACDPADVGTAHAHVVELAIGVGPEFLADAEVGTPPAHQQTHLFQ